MPITNEPQVIEQSEWIGGWAPDVDPVDLDQNMLAEAKNFLPDIVFGRGQFGMNVVKSATMKVRRGFQRVINGPETEASLDGYYVRNLFKFNDMPASGDHKRFLIAVISNDTDAADNIQIWAYDLKTEASARIDTPGRNWAGEGKRNHWGEAIQGVWYGGQRGELMYCWTPGEVGMGNHDWDHTNDVWNADCSTPTAKAWTDNVDGAIDTDNEYGRDFAFKSQTLVEYSGDFYTPSGDGIRYDKWNDGEHYSRGEFVSFHPGDNWGASGSDSYWKSFKCVADHVANDGVNDPETDSGTWAFWEKVRLAAPVNEDGDTTNDWNKMPVAAKSGLGVFHGERLWLRWDGHVDDGGNPSRLQYSAPLKPKRGDDIADLTFDPTDFRPGNDIHGDGGGWLDFRSGDGDRLNALATYGEYLIVLKRRSCWVVSGVDENTWYPRNIGHYGCVPSAGAICEHDGLIYFIGDQGLCSTDGTSVELVKGNDKIRDWIREQIAGNVTDGEKAQVEMWSLGSFLFFSIPVISEVEGMQALDPHVVAYHPESASFWLLDMPVHRAVVERDAGEDHAYLTMVEEYGDNQPILYEYGEVDVDDDGTEGAGTTDIAATMKTGWFTFGDIREDRRIRRSWAVVRGDDVKFTLTLFRNFDYNDNVATDKTPTDTIPTRVEGKVPADSMAVAYQVETDSAPASVLGIASMTQPRRIRYHVNSQ